METRKTSFGNSEKGRLFILPMRNGNFFVNAKFWLLVNLFILPMRNGNARIIQRPDELTESFYPTYEEWKHRTKKAL